MKVKHHLHSALKNGNVIQCDEMRSDFQAKKISFGCRLHYIVFRFRFNLQKKCLVSSNRALPCSDRAISIKYCRNITCSRTISSQPFPPCHTNPTWCDMIGRLQTKHIDVICLLNDIHERNINSQVSLFVRIKYKTFVNICQKKIELKLIYFLNKLN